MTLFIWFLVGLVLPILDLIAVVLYRGEQEEPERRCPTCGKNRKLHVQVCPALRRRPVSAGSF